MFVLAARGMRSALLALCTLSLISCNSNRSEAEGGDSSGIGSVTATATTSGTTGDATTSSTTGSDEKLDVGDGNTGATGGDGDGSCGGVEPPPPNATLKGFVFAPNLTIPISGALVYTATVKPDGIPDGVYCAQCQGIPCDHHHVFSEPDGSFELPAFAGTQYLVVIKGEFMHISQIEVVPGENFVNAEVSSLPGEWNPDEGHYIPRMAVMSTYNDTIYNVLGKIGLAEMDANGDLIKGTEQFDIFGYDGDYTEGQAILDNPGGLDPYHLVFIPCMSQGPLSDDFIGGSVDPNRAQNIRKWVEAGGKWYVTDWANEYLYDVFPPYQTFHDQAFDPDLGYYDSLATVLDPDLLAWLEALPAPLKDVGGGLPTLNALPQVELLDNWSGIDEIPEVIVQDMDGMDVNVGHYPWVEGPCQACSPGDVRPMTITARYGCGRMLFSTYHTNEAAHLGLSPQELILLYIILEIGVCDESPPPPVPPIG